MDILSQPVPKRFWRILRIGVLLLLLLGGIVWIVLLVDQAAAEAQIQQTLDRDCGSGKASAHSGYFTYDPAFRWNSSNASCYSDLQTGAFVCTCSSSP